jgi:hypothetical protein
MLDVFDLAPCTLYPVPFNGSSLRDFGLYPAPFTVPSLQDRAEREDTPSVSQAGMRSQPCKGDTLLTVCFSMRYGTSPRPQSRRDDPL